MTGPRVDPSQPLDRPLTGAEWAASHQAAAPSDDPVTAMSKRLGRPLTFAEFEAAHAGPQPARSQPGPIVRADASGGVMIPGNGTVLTRAEFDAVQSVPGHLVRRALQSGDLRGATTNGFGRPLTGDEWAQAQTMSPDQIRAWKIPVLPKPTIRRDVTTTPADANVQGKSIEAPIIGPLMRQLVDPVLEHPVESAPLLALGVPGVAAAAPLAAIATGLGLGASAVYHIAQYGWQKLAESQLDPETRKLAEADPERVSGESAAVQAAMLGLGALIHVGSRATDFSGGMMEAGARGLKGFGGGQQFSPEVIQGARDAAATSRFAAQLESGAQNALPVDVKPVKGLEPTAVEVKAGRVKPVEGLIVPENVSPGRVKPIATESPLESLERAQAEDAQRVQQEAMRPKRRPGGVKPSAEAAPFFESPQGAEVLGAMAARHGLPENANPYHPSSPLAPEWEAGHQSATQSYPLYPEGFSMGGALTDNRIPGASEVPATVNGVEGLQPTSIPEGTTPETAQLAAALKPSRFRGHSVEELVQIARSARETADRAQAQLDASAEADEQGVGARDANGKLRTNLGSVSADDLHAEMMRLTEQNANEEALHAGVQESGYRNDYLELPQTERLGIKGKDGRDSSDADGMSSAEQVAKDDKIVADFNKNQAVRAARTKAIGRIQRELDSRSGASFDFGLNAPGSAAESPTLAAERTVTRAKSTLAQVEREFALRGVAGDKLAAMINGERAAQSPSGGVEPIEGTGATKTRGLAAGVQKTALANRLELTVGEVPHYRVLSMADQAEKATALLSSDLPLAKRVALGEAPAPHGLLPESVFVAVEQKAIAEGDVATLRELATGKLTAEATTMGQRIRALAERDPDSPVAAIQDVIKKRSGGADLARATREEVGRMQTHLAAVTIEPGAFTDFLESLKC